MRESICCVAAISVAHSLLYSNRASEAMFKTILLELFKTHAKPAFAPGTRVNLCAPFGVQRSDGVVEAILNGQALVSWPNGASDWVDAGKLHAICS